MSRKTKKAARDAEQWVEGFREGIEERAQREDRAMERANASGRAIYDILEIGSKEDMPDRNKWLEMEHIAKKARDRMDEVGY